ncbi:MAG: TlpA family protein disulfide reductase [Tannerellaceae bacterium]|nr:TlpA family protein disulfide reductase [Tannerellaceae bacterium]
MKTLFYRTLWIGVMVISFSCIKEGDDTGYPYLEHEIEVGDAVPTFTVYENENQTGAVFSSEECKNKVTLLVFFNTGCKDCRRELPKVDYVFKALEENPLYQVVCIARDQGEEEIKKYWKDADNNFTMPAYVDPGRKVFTLFANQTVPRLYLINEKGTVTWLAIEELNIEKEELLEKMISQ